MENTKGTVIAAFFAQILMRDNDLFGPGACIGCMLDQKKVSRALAMLKAGVSEEQWKAFESRLVEKHKEDCIFGENWKKEPTIVRGVCIPLVDFFEVFLEVLG